MTGQIESDVQLAATLQQAYNSHAGLSGVTVRVVTPGLFEVSGYITTGPLSHHVRPFVRRLRYDRQAGVGATGRLAREVVADEH